MFKKNWLDTPLPIEVIHVSLFPFEIRPFTTQSERDTVCSSFDDIETDLLRIERDYRATLWQLAQHSRIILLLDGWEHTSHLEFIVAFSLLVAGMSGSSAGSLLLQDLPLSWELIWTSILSRHQ